MPDPVVTYECPEAGTVHAVPGGDVRVLKIGDGGFVIACSCGPEGLDVVDEAPHPSTDHLVNVYADDPEPADWLRLDDAADGWADTNAWATPEKDSFTGTNGQRRVRFRERVAELADSSERRGFEPTATEQAALDVQCPKCGADPGRKCQRPSGHQVRTPHAGRVERVSKNRACTGDPERSSQATLDRVCQLHTA